MEVLRELTTSTPRTSGISHGHWPGHGVLRGPAVGPGQSGEGENDYRPSTWLLMRDYGVVTCRVSGWLKQGPWSTIGRLIQLRVPCGIKP